jgi:hypothetical protein
MPNGLIWPSWRFRRAEDGRLEKCIFDGPHDVGKGWVQSPALIKWGGEEDPAPAPVSEPPTEDQSASLDLSKLSKADLADIAEKAGVTIDKRWGRARIEQALKEADSRQ